MLKKSVLPPKTLTMLQNIVCVVIMLVIVFMSFGTIFTAEVKSTEKTNEIFDSVVNSIGDGEAVAMPKQIDISMPFLVKSVGSLGKILGSAMNTMKDIAATNDSVNKAQDDIENDPFAAQDAMNDVNENANNLQNSANELAASLHNEDFVGLIALIVVVVSAFGESFILGLVYVALIALAVTLPIVAVINLIVAIVGMVKGFASPAQGHSTISKAYGRVFAMFPMLWVMKIVAPNVEFASGITVMIVLIVVGLVINLVASRLKAYSPVQFKYLNLLQIISAASIVGYFVFMLGLSKMNMFDHVWDSFIGFAKNAKFADVVLPTLLIMVAISLLTVAAKHIKNIACRLAVMMRVPTQEPGQSLGFAKDNFIATSAASLAIVVISVILMVTDMKLDFGDDMGMFVVFCLGIIIMFVSEILMVVLKKSVCPGITPEDVQEVLGGCPAPVEAEEAAEKITEAAEEVAEEAVEAVEEAAEEATEEATEEVVEEAIEEAAEELAEEAAEEKSES